MPSSMRVMKGFTLIETLITTAVLVPALAAVAFLFAYTTAANITNQQRTASTVLLSEKMETLRDAPLSSAVWSPGIYTDYVIIGTDGTLSTSGADANAPYLRTWQISTAIPRTATVIVSAQRAGLTRRPMEIGRATTIKTR
jgi:Tfp pilus assembly protein PilV